MYPYSNFPYPITTGASNVVGGDNPPYTLDTFYKWFPQFEGLAELEFLLPQFIAMADATVKIKRWHSRWEMGMGLFVAHFATLFLQTMGTGPECESTAASVLSAAQARGLQTSKSVGDVSVSYDYSYIINDLEGWAEWKSTKYGTSFATFAKMLGKAGMYVY